MGVARISLIALVLLGVGWGIWLIAAPGSPAQGPAAVESGPPPVAPQLKVSLLAFGTDGRRPIEDSGAVQAGEAVRIRVHLDAPAHVLVGRKDRLGGAHLMYPARAGGRAIALPVGGPHELGQPLATVQGAEELHVYACAQSVTWSDVRSLGERAGCTRVVRALKGP